LTGIEPTVVDVVVKKEHGGLVPAQHHGKASKHEDVIEKKQHMVSNRRKREMIGKNC